MQFKNVYSIVSCETIFQTCLTAINIYHTVLFLVVLLIQLQIFAVSVVVMTIQCGASCNYDLIVTNGIYIKL